MKGSIFIVSIVSMLFGCTTADSKTIKELGSKTLVSVDYPIRQLASGSSHTCALKLDGTIWCWGSPAWGALGNNSGGVQTSRRQDKAVQVRSSEKFVSLAVSGSHNCAISEAGDVWCWGINLNYELGLGDDDQRGVPEMVEGLSAKALTVATGEFHSCVVLADDSIQCWGGIAVSGDEGTFGGGALYASPVSVPHLEGHPIALSSGYHESCVLMRGGAVYCWGRGGKGVEEVDFGSDISAISMDQYLLAQSAICVLKHDDTLKCAFRSIVDGDQAAYDDFDSMDVVEDLRVTKLLHRSSHTCALTVEGQVWCWGNNQDGQLGTGDVFDRSEPYHVAVVTQATDLSMGTSFTCAAQIDGQVLCWGLSDEGQTGSPALTVDRVRGLDEPAIKVAVDYESCALLQSGAVKCWDQNDYEPGAVESMDQILQTVDGLNGTVVDIQSGGTFSCALLASGHVQCWGGNEYGELGAALPTQSYAPVDVNLRGEAESMALGSVHACAILTDGGVQCWGDDLLNQLGDSGNTNTTAQGATDVTGLRTAAVQIAAGYSSSCALLADASVECWGRFGDYQGAATDVEGLDQAALAVAAASTYMCVLLDSGIVQCLGTDIPTMDILGGYSELTPVDGLEGSVSQLDLGTYYACALHTLGDVECWGSDPLDWASDAYAAPHKVELPEKAVQVSVGHDSACFLVESGDVFCNAYYNSQHTLTEVGKHWSPTPVQGLDR